MAHSKVPLHKWAIAIYLCLTSLKSISSMKLHRDLGVSQPTAWFMLHRIREAWAGGSGEGGYSGPVEVDESYFGGRRRNMSNSKRKTLADTGRGPVGKVAVVGAKDRASNQVAAKVVRNTDAETLQGFVSDHAAEGATVFTDDATAYDSLPFAPCDGKALSSGVRQRHGPHQRNRVILVDAEASAQGNLPQDQPEAPRPLHAGVRRKAQHSPARDARSDARHRCPSCRS